MDPGRRHSRVLRHDSLDHSWLERFLEHRIADRRLLRLIRKWLRVGVLENGEVISSEKGTPQGAVISPLLANVYLHYVLDLWANQWRKRHARGDTIVVRYADDFVVGFQYKDDAERFLTDLRARLAAFALSLHPDKTRLIAFGRNVAANRRQQGMGKPETFRFLGFTHISGVSRRGAFQVRRKTRRDRMSATLKEIATDLRRRWHWTTAEQGAWLRAVVTGYVAYHAVPTNFAALAAFRQQVTRLWWRALRRRSQRDRTAWQRVQALAKHWLPSPRILHPWPSVRFDAKHQRQEPDAGIPLVRICAGGAQQ